MPYLTALGDYRKIITVMKVLRAKCAPVTGITNGTVIIRLETITDLGNQWIQSKLNINKKEIKKGTSCAVLNDFSSNY